MRSRTKWLRVALAVTAVWAMGVPTPAVADNWTRNKQGIIWSQPGQCVHGSVNQDHTWHDVSTWRTNCQNVWPTWHAQYQEYYKVRGWGQPGTYCFNNGWHQSAFQNSMYRFWGWDIWNWCNNGPGVHVILTVDSWQGSWDGNAQMWRIGSWRPATVHCHCP